MVLSTGRCLAEIRETLKILPQIRYLVCENGSCVYDCKYEHAIHLAPLPAKEILWMLNLVKNEDVVLQAFHDNMAYFDQPNGDWCAAFAVGNYREIFDRTAIWDDKLFDTFATRPFQVEKLNLYLRDEETRQRIHAQLKKRSLKTADSLGFMIETVSAGADKGIGLKKLCEHIGVDIKQTIAVGGSMNDIEILQAAGLSAAMGNACKEAKAAADIITDDCDHDGVAHVIERYLLN